MYKADDGGVMDDCKHIRYMNIYDIDVLEVFSFHPPSL